MNSPNQIMNPDLHRPIDNLSIAEYYTWKEHPVTQMFLQTIEKYLDDERLILSQGMTLNPQSADGTQASTAESVGKSRAYQEVLDLQPVENRK